MHRVFVKVVLFLVVQAKGKDLDSMDSMDSLVDKLVDRALNDWSDLHYGHLDGTAFAKPAATRKGARPGMKVVMKAPLSPPPPKPRPDQGYIRHYFRAPPRPAFSNQFLNFVESALYRGEGGMDHPLAPGVAAMPAKHLQSSSEINEIQPAIAYTHDISADDAPAEEEDLLPWISEASGKSLPRKYFEAHPDPMPQYNSFAIHDQTAKAAIHDQPAWWSGY